MGPLGDQHFNQLNYKATTGGADFFKIGPSMQEELGNPKVFWTKQNRLVWVCERCQDFFFG